MVSNQKETVTQLLSAAADGDSSVADQLLPLIYDELRELAASYFRNERGSHTLQPTALVHEAYLQLVDQTNIKWQSRNHFFAVAAKVMRNLLVNHALGKGRQKRGGGWQQVALDNVESGSGSQDVLEIVALDHALSRLTDLDQRKAQLVELRFFGSIHLRPSMSISK